MRKAVRAIVFHDNNLLVMHRNKFGNEYYALIGGGIDFGESAENALRREIKEESNLDIDSPKLVFIEEAGDPFGTQYIYLCDYVGGDISLQPNSEEAQINKMGKNLYEPLWLPIGELPNKPFMSPELKQALIDGINKGFPDKPITI
jgi:ADP-ribose pyrophosphatase YjhB (NUDIX family)